MQHHPSNKRIVSKTQYLSMMGGRIVGSMAALMFIALGILGMVAALICLLMAFFTHDILAGVICSIVIFFFFFLFIWMGVYSLSIVLTDDEIAPLTRQTAKTLPEQDSLMRASSLQDVPAETVLLRPIQNGSDPLPELLLRPPPMSGE